MALLNGQSADELTHRAVSNQCDFHLTLRYGTARGSERVTTSNRFDPVATPTSRGSVTLLLSHNRYPPRAPIRFSPPAHAPCARRGSSPAQSARRCPIWS